MADTRLGILFSGRGSNMLALARACQNPDFPADVGLVLTNSEEAPGLEAAAKMDLPTKVISHKDFEDRDSFESAMDAALRDAGVNLICLAGFMRLLNPTFVNSWKDRIINIHPSLLPAFRGLNTHARVLEAGVCFSGATVHFVRPEMDDGPIIIQAAVPVLKEDTPGTLAKRVLDYEHKIYVEAVRLIATGKIRVSGGQVIGKLDGQKERAGLINPAPPNNQS